MKILFVNGNLYGHMNPMIPVMRELTERGNEVWCFCSPKFRDVIEKTGVGFLDYGPEIELIFKNYIPHGNHPFYEILEYILIYDEVMIPSLLKAIKSQNINFDCIICDSILGGGYFIKKLLNIPTICSHSSFALDTVPVPPRMMVPGFHPQLDWCYNKCEELCDK